MRVDFSFVPSSVRVAIGGRRIAVAAHNREISWRARQSGGVTINATGARGWVIYVTRLKVRP